jgi:putative nucleotidyltransferase with HDIG domain
MSTPAPKQTRKSFIEDLRKEENKSSIFNILGRPFKSPRLLFIGLLFYCGVATVIALPREHPLRKDVPLRQDIVSRVDFSFEDEAKTKDKRRAAEESVPPIFKLEEKKFGKKMAEEIVKDLKVLFQEIHNKADLKTPLTNVRASWKESLSEKDFLHLKKELAYAKGEAQSSTLKLILQSFDVFINKLTSRYWISANNEQDLNSSYSQSAWVEILNVKDLVERSELSVYKIKEGEKNPASEEVSLMLDLSEQTGVHSPLSHFHEDKNKSTRILTELFVSCIAVNIEIDLEKTKAARNDKSEGVTSTYDFSKDKVILHRGDMPTEIDFTRIEAERAAFAAVANDNERIYQAGGRILIFTLFYLIFLTVLTEQKSRITRNQGRFFSFSVLTFVIIFSTYWFAQRGWSSLAVPFLFVAEVYQIAYKRRDSMLGIVFMGATLTLVTDVPGLALALTVGSMVALYCSRSIKTRLTLLFSGLVGGVTMALVDLAHVLPWFPWGGQEAGFNVTHYLSDSVTAFLAGIVTGILITVILPFIEKIFRITTPLTWLELGNMNHPALKRISMHSPGTWQHSLMLSALSEAGSEAIGGDGLMSRVVCYYHDLGKSLKPQYYIENQGAGTPNPHDRLTPAMSALIIHSHPKDGAELARQYNLPDQVIDAILQHHGTTRVEYFYRMAMKNADHPDDVSEDKYTYPGPKPQYKEMGVIMLADSAESATRSLKNPTPGKIRSTIENVVESKMAQGQLDESGLTLTEISKVIETFTRVINNIHHHRIEYPEDPRKTAEKNDSQKPSVPAS